MRATTRFDHEYSLCGATCQIAIQNHFSQAMNVIDKEASMAMFFITRRRYAFKRNERHFHDQPPLIHSPIPTPKTLGMSSSAIMAMVFAKARTQNPSSFRRLILNEKTLLGDELEQERIAFI